MLRNAQHMFLGALLWPSNVQVIGAKRDRFRSLV